MHLGAVVSAAPSPLSTPVVQPGTPSCAWVNLLRNATGQAPTLSGANAAKPACVQPSHRSTAPDLLERAAITHCAGCAANDRPIIVSAEMHAISQRGLEGGDAPFEPLETLVPTKISRALDMSLDLAAPTLPLYATAATPSLVIIACSPLARPPPLPLVHPAWADLKKARPQRRAAGSAAS